MRENIGKALSILICVVMISTVFVMDQSTINKPESNDIDESVAENEDTQAVSEPQLRGTRTDTNGTILGGLNPQAILTYPGSDFFTWGMEIEINDHDVTVGALGAYWGDYPDDYHNIRLWTTSGTLLGQTGPLPAAAEDWTWGNIPDVTLSAGQSYIISAAIYTTNGSLVAVENPGGSPDGTITTVRTVYHPGLDVFPIYDYGITPLPMVDILHYNPPPYGGPDPHDIYDIVVPDDYLTIQEAIDAASPGDSVFVRNNTSPYEEELSIDKTIELIGENRVTTIIDASSVVGGSGNVIHITGGFVNLSEFTITGGDCGIFLDNTNDCEIRSNIITENNDYGVYLNSINNDTIENNLITSNNIDGDSEGYGIYAKDSHAKGVWGNNIKKNKVGVKLINSWLWGCINWNYIINNDIGVDYDPEHLEIDGNIFLYNRIAIKISGDDSPILISNNHIYGSHYGIYIETGSPVIEGNIFENNIYAIYYVNDSSPQITNNTFKNNLMDIFYFIWAKFDFNPDTLNLKSKGRWMTCYVELPGDSNVNEIDLSTLRISKINDNHVDIPAEIYPTGIEDYDGDGISELMVKFDRSEVQDAVGLGENELTLTGQLNDGSELSGSDSIIVKSPP